MAARHTEWADATPVIGQMFVIKNVKRSEESQTKCCVMNWSIRLLLIIDSSWLNGFWWDHRTSCSLACLHKDVKIWPLGSHLCEAGGKSMRNSCWKSWHITSRILKSLICTCSIKTHGLFIYLMLSCWILCLVVAHELVTQSQLEACQTQWEEPAGSLGISNGDIPNTHYAHHSTQSPTGLSPPNVSDGLIIGETAQHKVQRPLHMVE